MGEGLPLHTGLQAFKWEPVGGRGWKWGRRSREGRKWPGRRHSLETSAGLREEASHGEGRTGAWECGGLGWAGGHGLLRAWGPADERPSSPSERSGGLCSSVTPARHLSAGENHLLLSALLGCHQLVII